MSAINWLYAQAITGAIEFPTVWNSRLMLVSISDAAAPGWRIMGKLRIEVEIGGKFYKAATRSIEFGESLIEIPYNAYRLSFLPSERTRSRSSIQIKIAPIELTMYISNPPEQLPALGAPIYAQVPSPTGTDALLPFLVVAARARRSTLITNKTNAALYICEGEPALSQPLVAGDPYVLIPPGGQYSVEDWSGDIAGIFATAPTGGQKILVKEIPYVNSFAVVLPTPPVVVLAPAIIPISIPFGSLNLQANGMAAWRNAQGTVTSGALCELFVVDGKGYGRNTSGGYWTSALTSPGWTQFSDAAAYKAARDRATRIVQTANCPPLP